MTREQTSCLRAFICSTSCFVIWLIIWSTAASKVFQQNPHFDSAQWAPLMGVFAIVEYLCGTPLEGNAFSELVIPCLVFWGMSVAVISISGLISICWKGDLTKCKDATKHCSSKTDLPSRQEQASRPDSGVPIFPCRQSVTDFSRKRCLNGWLEWRFGLIRLVISVTVLSVIVGLNMRAIGPMVTYYDEIDDRVEVDRFWGWPFPFLRKAERWDCPRQDEPKVDEWRERVHVVRQYELPISHLTYAFVGRPGVFYGLLDILFALTLVGSILFVRIPHRPFAPQSPPPFPPPPAHPDP